MLFIGQVPAFWTPQAQNKTRRKNTGEEKYSTKSETGAEAEHLDGALIALELSIFALHTYSMGHDDPAPFCPLAILTFPELHINTHQTMDLGFQKICHIYAKLWNKSFVTVVLFEAAADIGPRFPSGHHGLRSAILPSRCRTSLEMKCNFARHKISIIKTNT